MTRGSIVQLIFIIVTTALCSPAYATDRVRVHQETTSCTAGNLQDLRDVRLSEKLYGLPGLDNVGRISSCVYRGKQPAAEGYQTLKAMGMKTVINLRASHGERKAVENAGMRYLEFPLSMTSGIRKERFQEIIRAMSDPVNQPVYIHCALGQDRTGVVVAAYRMDVDGWSFQDVEKEMQSFGFNDTWIHLKKSLKNFAKQKGKVQKP